MTASTTSGSFIAQQTGVDAVEFAVMFGLFLDGIEEPDNGVAAFSCACLVATSLLGLDALVKATQVEMIEEMCANDPSSLSAEA